MFQGEKHRKWGNDREKPQLVSHRAYLHTIFSKSEYRTMETTSWCTKGNVIHGKQRLPGWTPALVPCIGSGCDRWDDGNCGLMDTVVR